MRKKGLRTLIVGAGVAGRMALQEIRRHAEEGYVPVGFIDDDPKKKGTLVDGLPVFGGREILQKVVEANGIESVLLAIPTASGSTVRELIGLCSRSGVECRIVPGLWDIIKGDVHIQQIREVRAEDLLGRETVNLEGMGVGGKLSGKVVLVTGAGGSIGSEICRQTARFSPSSLVLLGKGENSIFEIERELEFSHSSVNVVSVIADITNRPRIRRVLERFRPKLLFHAAAHKHVPLMETNAEEAVRNNIVGTKVLVEEASRAGCERMVMLSTDKAVSPTSVMGATKRVAEMYLSSVSSEIPMKLVAVRFGNVLGSRGSVVPLFQRQIEFGGPVTVTHPEATRYFMTVREAAQLVIAAGTFGETGNVYLLDMGEPMKILELAEHLISLSGYEPGKEIPIVFTGLRPGEKLHESLVSDNEVLERTGEEKIMVVRTNSALSREKLLRAIEELEAMAELGNSQSIISKLGEILPDFRRGKTS